MSQVVIYRGIVVTPSERAEGRIRVETTNMIEAQRAGLAFHEMREGQAVFAAWVDEKDLIPVDAD